MKLYNRNQHMTPVETSEGTAHLPPRTLSSVAGTLKGKLPEGVVDQAAAGGAAGEPARTAPPAQSASAARPQPARDGDKP
jgi:hypothetical protein